MSKSETTYRYPNSCIAMFARAPILGQVKTRLIPALGEQGALDMHLQLMNRQFEVLNESSLCSVQLWVDRSIDHQAFNKFSGELKLQQGDSLGEKMFYAAQVVLQKFNKVVIIGSDCPGIDEVYLEQALQALNAKTNDVVLGPALDGGYVLIAMKLPQLEIFQDIDWGTEFVLKQTLNKLQAEGIGFSTLPPLMDIDTPEDLKSLL
ncbi:MAG: TIGR04282 family arsenosugar biosynthesis glycosyltransferase [Gammaproteobacteria bacterium]|jgi:uncharacterized protein|nr:TIGR04282 family arsenosugar biosynthesis glycosyltransferase [Gammaproteobacteria bacterium]